MKLINWHRFENCTIDFGSSTLISGENGAGKSTLLDAIQFVITCSSNHFNKAAHENGKRKLTGYIRCKTGRENQPYERTGQISAHIALEFYEEERNRSFIVGAVIDSASEGQETTVRYLMDNVQLEDDLFLQGMVPKSIAQFRTTNNKKIKQWCKTQTEAKKVMKARFGRIEDKFFRLIPKALAFRPIDDIKDFVYSYVLDEKEVNIEVLKENVRTYQDFERTLEGVKKRIQKLEMIEQYHKEVLDAEKRDEMYGYFLERASLDLLKEEIKREERFIELEKHHLNDAGKLLNSLENERDEKQTLETMLRVELSQNEEFLALEQQTGKLEQLKKKEQGKLNEKRDLNQSFQKAIRQAEQLLEFQDVASCVMDYKLTMQKLKQSDGMEDLAEVKDLLEHVLAYKKEMYEKLSHKLMNVQIQEKNLKTENLELRKKIEKLSKKQLSYPEAVDRVTESIKREFVRIGRKPEPRVLCEMLEIKDEEWRNAVEGYLNTQRFYVLVEPENFDIALGTYDKLRKSKKAYGVGLINAQNLERFEQAPKGTLAEVVTSKNIYAKRFINMILGKVQRCSRYDDLKKYPTSITKECMKYQNRVASAIKPTIFEVPFIGKQAVKIQLEQAKNKKKKLEEQMKVCEKQRKSIQEALKPLETEVDIDIKYRLDVMQEIAFIRIEMKKCMENIHTLKENSSMIQKQIELDALQKIRKELEREIGAKREEIGTIKEKIKAKQEYIEEKTVLYTQQEAVIKELEQQAGEVLAAWSQDYVKHTEDKSFQTFYNNYKTRQKANITIGEKSKQRMINVMIQYKTEHDFGAAPTMEGYPDFYSVYERLKTSELLEYEEKVQSAKQAAEAEFREQFLAKLQENMKQAQSEFNELNAALKDITFSNERYKFLYMPSKKYRSYYEMIMDDFNAMEGESIFSGIFHETHKAVIDELFERLALNNDNNAKVLDEFTDYRTYMDYDLQIIHEDGSYSLYSKVCEEKSGGETQTPFYVTVAASFVQLYSGSIGGESIGLVLFDEAFNNMDDERIGGVLKFLRRLPLQIIIAAPPDKIQYISPVVEETLLIMTDGKVSYAERYLNAAI